MILSQELKNFFTFMAKIYLSKVILSFGNNNMKRQESCDKHAKMQETNNERKHFYT